MHMGSKLTRYAPPSFWPSWYLSCRNPHAKVSSGHQHRVRHLQQLIVVADGLHVVHVGDDLERKPGVGNNPARQLERKGFPSPTAAIHGYPLYLRFTTLLNLKLLSEPAAEKANRASKANQH